MLSKRLIVTIFTLMALTAVPVPIASQSKVDPLMPPFGDASTSTSSRTNDRTTRNRPRPNRDRVRDSTRPGGTLSRKNREKLDECVRHILIGPGKKGIKITGHKFNCKPLQTWRASGDMFEIGGTLSHALRFRPDDQVKFSFNMSKNGDVSRISHDIKRGGAGKWARSGFKFIPPAGWVSDSVKWMGSTVTRIPGDLVDGSWQGTAKLITASVAFRIAGSVKAAESRRRIGSRPVFWYIDRPGNDYKHVNLPKHQWAPEFCQNMCGLDGKCRAWTFNKLHPTKGPAACYLKTRGGKFTISNRTVSGTQQRRSRR